MSVKPVVTDSGTIAFCGLYCGACKRYLRESCPGCPKNDRASWCTVRSCCIEHEYRSCADCTELSNIAECRKLHNFIAKVVGIVLNSNRDACLAMIKEKGYDGFAEHMASRKLQTLPRR
jgi:hypothetical protein